MPRFEVSEDVSCPICDHAVVINALPDVKPGLGVCDECGLPHSFTPLEPSDENVVLDSAEPSLDREVIDWKIIESYYEATGNRAVTVGCCEYTEEIADAFDSWANEEYDMYWGMSVEEAKANGYDGS